MILDELLEFADASTDIQASTGRALIGDVIDLGATPQDFGIGKAMYLVIQVDTDIDSAADGATAQFILATDAVAAVAVDGSASEHLLTEVFAEADLVAGKTIVLALPPGGAGTDYERYMGVIALVGGETITAGAVNAFLTFDPTYWKSYADGQN
jgi:hypothetical protein